MADKRRPKQAYHFEDRRAGDVITVADAAERTRLMSAFINWKRDKPGTLSVSSRRVEAGYTLTFTGVSPYEVGLARFAARYEI